MRTCPALCLLASLFPTPLRAEPPKSREEAARLVVAAVLAEARANARRPTPKKGDALTQAYVRAAARAARDLPAKLAPAALALGLGIALEDTDLLPTNALTSGVVRKVEPEALRKQRLAVLGSPTLHGRRDLCQHFAVSCVLTELIGAELAETAGVFKEQLDMKPGGSGFSFADLAGDLAGIAFTQKLKAGKLTPKRLAEHFTVADFVPTPRGLPEGLPEKEFVKKFGSVTDKRYRAQLDSIRKHLRMLPGYK
jgi:hypothetical protein